MTIREASAQSTPQIEPAALSEGSAAEFLSISPRLLRQLIVRGDLKPIKIPGIRRIVFDVADLRALLSSWKKSA